MKIALFSFIFLLLISLSYSCENGQIDINSASLQELDNLAGIGKVKAQAIIDSRPFDSIDELIKIKGIGNVTLEKIKTQGLACVDGTEQESIDEKEPKEIEQKQEQKEIIKDEFNKNEKVSNQISEKNQTPEIIILNSTKIEDKVVYESKNEKIKNWGIYGFALFLIFIIIILLLKR